MKKSKYVLMPDEPFKRYWNVLMIFLLIYVATYVPFDVCFNDNSEVMDASDYLDIIVDFLFTIDILVNFMSSYEDPVT